MTDDGTTASPALERLKRLTRWRTPPPRVRGVLLVLAVVVFVAGGWLSLRDLDLAVGDLVWWPLVVVTVVGTPATIALNAAELRAMTRLVPGAVAPGWGESIRIVVVATAANILPIPGGALVRVHALRTAGTTVAQATVVTLLAALLWVGTAVGMAGAAAFVRAPLAATVALVGAGVAVAVTAVGVRSVTSRWSGRRLGWLTAVELATTLLHAARLWLVLVGLGIDAQVMQALVLGAAAPLAAAAGVFPSGLGLSELLSALLAPVVALPAAAGFASAALARLLGLAGTIPVALALGVRDLRPPADPTA